MQRIAIIGSSGSGKSTLALQLHALLQLPVYHLDQYYWQPNWVAKSFEEFAQIHSMLCNKHQWIIEGIYTKTFEERIKAANTVIYLDFSRFLCIYRILKRLYYHYNITTPTSAPECPERFDIRFIRYVWNFNTYYKKNIVELLTRYLHQKRIFIFTTPQQVQAFITTIKKEKL